MQVLKDLKEAELKGNCTGLEKLEATVMEEVIETVHRQLLEVSFVCTDSSVDVDALKQAPSPNLGCEYEFAKLDNRLRTCRGKTSVSMLSRKNVVLTNRLLVNSKFEEKSLHEKRRSWKWARCFNEIQQVKKLEENFISSVKETKKIALLKKEEMKKKKLLKVLIQIDICKEHVGPVTPKSLHCLENFS